MPERFDRTALLIGDRGLYRLNQAKVAIFGIGGVGSYAAEALARAGVGYLTLVDSDIIDTTNLNRQVHATERTIGQPKVCAMKERIEIINPDVKTSVVQASYGLENARQLVDSTFDYILDAMDDVVAKVGLIAQSKDMQIPLVSCMGTAGRLEGSSFRLADIAETYGCPLARAVRKKLKKTGIVKGVKVVFSPERPVKSQGDGDRCAGYRGFLGTISFVPPMAGLLMVEQCIRDLLGLN